MRGTKAILIAVLCVFILASSSALWAQQTPYLSQDEIRMLINEISGDRAYDHIRWLSHWARERGSEGYFEAVDYIVEAAKDAGLEDVKFIEQQPRSPGTAYNARSAELWMVEPVEVKLADIGSHVLYLATNSYDADVTAELVWIGDGSEGALEGKDVKGKIVLTSGQPGAAVANAVWKMGAAGVVSYPMNGSRSRWDNPDQIARASVPRPSEEGQEGTFAFVLSTRAGETLRHILEIDGEQDLFRTGNEDPRRAYRGQSKSRYGVQLDPCANRDGGGLDPREQVPRPADRSHLTHPGRGDIGQRRCQRYGKHAGDGPRVHQADPRGKDGAALA